MVPLLVCGSILIAWSLLSQLGNYHQDKLSDLRARTSAEPPAVEVSADTVSSPKTATSR
jgi:hypothetical protein